MGFKVGDIVKLKPLHASAVGVPVDTTFKVVKVDGIDLLVEYAGRSGWWMASRFELAPAAYVPVTLTYTFKVDSGRHISKPKTDQTEARLMSIWKSVPSGCCPSCSAPLPCDYHPVGALKERDEDEDFDDGDPGF